MGGRSNEESAQACQVKCAATPTCAAFSFWPDGGCHLQDANSTPTFVGSVVSGPRTGCTQAQTASTTMTGGGSNMTHWTTMTTTPMLPVPVPAPYPVPVPVPAPYPVPVPVPAEDW